MTPSASSHITPEPYLFRAEMRYRNEIAAAVSHLPTRMNIPTQIFAISDDIGVARTTYFHPTAFAEPHAKKETDIAYI